MKELLKEKTLWISTLICFLSLLIAFPSYQIKIPLETGGFVKLYQKALEAQVMLFLLPIASVLPLGAIYVKESSSGFLRLYITRISRMQYIRRKLVQIYASGFLPFFFAGAIALLLSFLLVYPMELEGEIPWEDIWKSCRFLLRISLTGGILAQIAGIFAAVFRNYYMAYGLPFVCYYLLIILKERYFTDMYAMYPAEWLKCEQDWGMAGMGIWIFLSLFSVTALLFHGLLLYNRLREV